MEIYRIKHIPKQIINNDEKMKKQDIFYKHKCKLQTLHVKRYLIIKKTHQTT